MSDISYLQNGEPNSADILNRPVRQLAEKVAQLEAELAAITGRSSLVTEGVPYDAASPVSVGNLVYMGSDGLIRPALSVWSANADAGGVVVPADSAYVYGMVVSVDADSATASVATGGTVDRTSALISGLLPEGTLSVSDGLWYLSDTVPGKVMLPTGGRPYMRTPVVCLGSGGIRLTGAVPYSGYHMHKCFTIGPDATWTESDGSYTYSGEAVADLTFFNWKDATFIVDGVEDYAGVFGLEENNGSVVVVASSDPFGKTVRIYTAVPDSHAEPVVRGIRFVGSGRAYASSQDGLVTIGIDGWEGQAPDPGYSDRAVSGLTADGGYTMTKVVSRLKGDATVTVKEGSGGQWTISAVGGPFLKPVTTNLENATIASSNGALYYVFPKSRVSAVMGSISVPAPPEGCKWKASPFVTAAASTVAVTATLVFHADTDFGSAGAMPSAVSGSLAVSATAGTGTMTQKSSDSWEITSGGDAWLRLASSGSNAADMNILSFGLWLEVVEA